MKFVSTDRSIVEPMGIGLRWVKASKALVADDHRYRFVFEDCDTILTIERTSILVNFSEEATPIELRFCFHGSINNNLPT